MKVEAAHKAIYDGLFCAVEFVFLDERLKTHYQKYADESGFKKCVKKYNFDTRADEIIYYKQSEVENARNKMSFETLNDNTMPYFQAFDCITFFDHYQSWLSNEANRKEEEEEIERNILLADE